MALSEAQGQKREVRALPEPQALEILRPDLPCAKDPGPSVGEGMIPKESRMLEIGTSGLTSGGEETWLRKRLRHRHRAKAAG